MEKKYYLFRLKLRKVWSISLVPFLERIPGEIDELLHSSCATVHQTLRRVCAQLADLGPNLASIIARCALFGDGVLGDLSLPLFVVFSRVILLAITEIDKQDMGGKEEGEKESEGKKDSR